MTAAAVLTGPLLRHADATSATIWVETDRPCTVEVLGHRAATFSVCGHHYALVTVAGLTPGTDIDYEVALDGRRAWPAGGPAGRIRTPSGSGAQRLLCGSCRVAGADGTGRMTSHGAEIGDLGPDALAAVARRSLADPAGRPDLLVLAGDQLYSDVLSPATRAFVAARRSLDVEHGDEVTDFEEYAFAYRDSWTADEDVRWLLASVPSVMIFDDHDVHDGWNSSQRWYDAMVGLPGGQERMTAALASYWVYQHLGNVAPGARGADAAVDAALAGGDATAAVVALARATVAGGAGAPRWSYRRDLDGARVVVVDSRSARVLAEGDRSMLPASEWAWLAGEVAEATTHLVVVTSVPLVLPQMVERLEAWSDRTGAGAWGRVGPALAGRLRSRFGLEHWPAYGDSANRFVELLGTAGGAARPRSVTVVSGEVHYSYLARIEAPAPTWQLVSSPLRNRSTPKLRMLHRTSSTRLAGAVAAGVARLAGAVPRRFRAALCAGPWFGNVVATLVVDGDAAEAVFETVAPDGDGGPALVEVHRARLDAAQATSVTPPTARGDRTRTPAAG